LVDFVAKFTSRVENEVDEIVWIVKVDGLSNKEAGGVRVVLETPKKDVIQYAIWLQFLTNNNETKYEALLTGLKLTKSMGDQKLYVYNDSQLVNMKLFRKGCSVTYR